MHVTVVNAPPSVRSWVWISAATPGSVVTPVNTMDPVLVTEPPSTATLKLPLAIAAHVATSELVGDSGAQISCPALADCAHRPTLSDVGCGLCPNHAAAE